MLRVIERTLTTGDGAPMVGRASLTLLLARLMTPRWPPPTDTEPPARSLRDEHFRRSAGSPPRNEKVSDNSIHRSFQIGIESVLAAPNTVIFVLRGAMRLVSRHASPIWFALAVVSNAPSPMHDTLGTPSLDTRKTPSAFAIRLDGKSCCKTPADTAEMRVRRQTRTHAADEKPLCRYRGLA